MNEKKFKCLRLQKVAHVVHFWEFISSALTGLADKGQVKIDLEAIRKTMHWMVIDHQMAWFSVVVDSRQNPVAFAVAYDATPPFEDEKTWAVKWFYHAPGSFDATIFLKKEFDLFAKSAGINRYLVTTSRLSGGAIRCFQSERFGFKKAYLTFEHVM